MKFITGILLTIILGAIFQSFLPWWTLWVGAVLCGLLIPLSGLQNFAYGFFGGSLLWGGYAWWLDAANTGILSTRMAALFNLPSGFGLVLITLVLGGLLAGLGAMTGYFGRRLWFLGENRGK